MKRFYQQAEAVAADGGYAIRLDGRPVHTPARAPLVLPTRALGNAVAGEWQGQGETIDPRTMPLTGLANAAIDRVAPDREAFAAGLARYGESDLLCYRAAGPDTLVGRQAEAWDPILDWARHRYDVEFAVTAGVMHSAQPPETVARLAKAVAARDAFTLAALSPLVTVSGSLLIALALAEQAIDPDAAWAAAALDDLYQAEQWGADTEAAAALEARKGDFTAGKRMLDLLA